MAALEKLLHSALDWSKMISFETVPSDVAQVVKGCFHQHQRLYTERIYKIFSVTTHTLKPRFAALSRKQIQLSSLVGRCTSSLSLTGQVVRFCFVHFSSIPSGFFVTNLQPEQAHLVNSLWEYSSGEDTEKYIKDIVTKLPSCCLYNTDGNVVGFALMYHYGYLGMLYVFEEHRGKGYGKMIMSHLAYVGLQNATKVCLEIEKENMVSIKLHRVIGFELEDESDVYLLTSK